MKFRLFLSLVVMLVCIVGGAGAQDAPRVLATTSILADVAQNVAGDLLTVESLLPADADAHVFEPSPADVARVAEADLLLVVGAGYEAFLGDLLANAGDAAAEVVVASNGIDILALGGEHDEHEGEHEHAAAEHIGILGEIECEAHEHEEDEAEHEDEHEHGACDPHVWTDPMNGVVWADNIAAAFSVADPANEDIYRANADAYIAQLETLDAEISETLAVIPEESRILVTNHEFMGYFAAAYDFEVVATVLPGGTTDAEPNPQELAALIELIEAEGVSALFAEVSANSQLAEVVAQEAGISVVTTLYSEALSAADGPASTYVDYLRYNASVIAEALAG
jgi:ABC-type Zn uptake system ZnuABC Zn-binding protein ZnuA